MRVHPAYARRRRPLHRHRSAYGADALTDKQMGEMAGKLGTGLVDRALSAGPIGSKGSTTITYEQYIALPSDQQSAAVALLSPEDQKRVKMGAVAALAGVGLLLVAIPVQIFGINPWIVKAFKPEWSYGRRLGASFGVSFVAGTLIGVAKGFGGVKDAA